MAHPITFKPLPVDPKQELMRQLERAPREHAEALLVAYDLLQTAHDKGVLDLLHGLVGGRDIVAARVAQGMALPETVSVMRNAIALSRILAAIDPAVLHGIAEEMDEAAAPKLEREMDETQAKTAPLRSAERPAAHAIPPVRRSRHHMEEPPSLWQLFKRATSKDGRRGMAYALSLLTSVGRALRPQEKASE